MLPIPTNQKDLLRRSHQIADQEAAPDADERAAQHARHIHEIAENLEKTFESADPNIKFQPDVLDPNVPVIVRYEGRFHHAIYTEDSAGTSILVRLAQGTQFLLQTSGPGWFPLDLPAGTFLYSGDSNRHFILVRMSNIYTTPNPTTYTISELVSPIGTISQQLEVTADFQPSHGIVSGTTNLRQTQSTTATGVINQGQAGSVIITPTTMLTGMVPQNEIDIDVGAATQEPAYILSVTATTITVQPVNGSPGAPIWKFGHSGTYKVQVGVYNVERDITGEGSGFIGTGMPPAVEIEWGAGGPPLASGLPSLDQYDRETLIVGQGPSDSQAINATLVGDTIITLTAAHATLLPQMPIRLSGAATAETVYVDQSYLVGNNTVIALKHPVVNAGQVLATWQRYSPNGPGTGKFLLYGEGMEGIALNDGGSPGFALMQQANSDNIRLITAVGVTVTQNSADQSNPNWRGIRVYANMTNAGTGSITVNIQGKDPDSLNYDTILASAAIVANGVTVLKVYPGLPATANVSANDILPRTWRVSVVANNANATTYNVSCSLEV